MEMIKGATGSMIDKGNEIKRGIGKGWKKIT